jgi:acetolactate synthase-1/2/3 large subunit
MGERPVASAFDDFDHAAIARAMGCEAIRVDSVEALRKALLSVGDHLQPFVIDVPTSLATSFRDITQPIAGNRWK